MPHTSWMIERLNSETLPFHAQADADFDILFAPEAPPAHYLMFLTRAYGFEAPLESTLAMTPNLDLMIDLRERQKSGYIAQDLLGLGLRPAEVADVAQCMSIPEFPGAAEALGWMYVVERTTLAHSVIRRHLSTKLPREIRKASAYLSCYTGVVGTRWRQFGTVLDLVGRHPAIADRIVAAAQDAFHCQRRWITNDHASVTTLAV
jgi:heme oxygenase